MRFIIAAFAALAAALPSAEPEPEPVPQAGAAAGVTPGTLATGPHKAGFWAEPTLPRHTIFAPIDLASAGKLPILIWGNGACSANGTYFRRSLFEVASHGVRPSSLPNVSKNRIMVNSFSKVLCDCQRRPDRRWRSNNVRPPESKLEMDRRKRGKREIRPVGR